MLSEILVALKSLKAASDIADGFSNLKTEAAVNEKVIELQNIILALQNQLFSFQSSYEELNQEKKELLSSISKMKEWEIEKDKFELTEINLGIFVYTYKQKENSVSDKHWFCANCFDSENKLSVFQNKKGGNNFYHVYSCPKCKNEIKVKNEEFKKINLPKTNRGDSWLHGR